MRIVNPAKRRELRASAHSLKPVVIIADRGLEESVVEETKAALEHHELIKVRIRQPREERKALTEALCEACGAALIQSIGQIIAIYRPRPAKPAGKDNQGARQTGPWSNSRERKRSTDGRRGTRSRPN